MLRPNQALQAGQEKHFAKKFLVWTTQYEAPKISKLV